jgi:hypothetical protein
MKNTLKWKPASIVYPTDHLISSKAREVGAWGFKPQYESVRTNFPVYISYIYVCGLKITFHNRIVVSITGRKFQHIAD